MADKDFIVKNGIVVNTGFAANSSQFTLSTINSTSSGILANSTVITIGNSTVNVTVNSTSFSGNAATLAGDTLATIKGYVTTNASAAYTNATTFSANATNLTNGTIPYARLDVNVINTTAAFTITGTRAHSANITFNATAGIIANGSIGSNGQALISNGSSLYWATATAGNNTQIQFNDSQTANASAAFVFNKVSNTVTIGNTTVYSTVNSTAFTGTSSYVGGNTATDLNTYASTKANDAYTNAVSFATTRSDAAFTNASSRADNAYTNAVSFATTRSDAAYANAVTYVNTNTRAYANATNNLGIGGAAAYAYNGAAGNFYTNGTGGENQIGCFLTGYNACYLFNNSSQWGLYSVSGGSLIFHDRSTNTVKTAALTNTRTSSLGVGTDALGTAGVIAATGDIYSAYSDERLKTKLGPITDALDKVKSLNGFFYQPNDTALALGFNDKIEKRVGVSAQEVQAVLPEAVHPAPKDNTYLTVQYEKIVPLLIEAIKELSAKLDAKCSNCSCGGK